MSSKSKTTGARESKVPKSVETTNDKSGAPLAPVAPPTLDTSGAPQTNVGAALAALDAKRIETNDAPPSQAQTGGAYTLVGGAGASVDVLGGRIGARTHDIHIVLCELALKGRVVLKTSLVEAQATALSESQGRPKCKASASHLNTMRGRNFVVRENGAWRLSNTARKLVQLAPLTDVIE